MTNKHYVFMFSGSNLFDDKYKLLTIFDEFLEEKGIDIKNNYVTLVEGGERSEHKKSGYKFGLDYFVGCLAREKQCNSFTFHAKFNEAGKKAGSDRNVRMVDHIKKWSEFEDIEVYAFAFPHPKKRQSPGTWSFVNAFKKRFPHDRLRVYEDSICMR